MATGIGYLSYCGMKEQAAHRTALAASDKVPFVSEGVTEEIARIESDWLDGKSGRRGDEAGPRSVTGPIEAVMVHDEVDSGEFVGVGLPIASAMGTATWSAGEGVNQITLAESPAESLTVAFEKTVSVHELVGTQFKGFTITGSSGTDFRCTLDCMSYDYDMTPVNVSGDLTSLPTVIPSRWLFGDVTFRMSTDFSDALAAADNIAISSFTLNYGAGMSDPEWATPLNAVSDPYGTDALRSMKSERNDFRDVTVEITIPRYTANTWRTAHQADSPIQAWMQIYASATRRAWMYFPYMKIINISQPIAGPNFIVETITLRCFRGTDYSGGTGNAYSVFTDTSTTIDEEFAIELDSDRTAAIIT
jgi:hypothetical protein